MEILYFGRVQDGSLRITNRKAFDRELTTLEGKEVEVSVRKKRKYRSNYQNRYYWGVIIPIVRQALWDTGHEYSNESVHEILKYRFLKQDYHIKDGEFFTETRSTKDLTTSEFMDYIAQIQRWTSEMFGVYIPDPGEQMEIDYA